MRRNTVTSAKLLIFLIIALLHYYASFDCISGEETIENAIVGISKLTKWYFQTLNHVINSLTNLTYLDEIFSN